MKEFIYWLKQLPRKKRKQQTKIAKKNITIIKKLKPEYKELLKSI